MSSCDFARRSDVSTKSVADVAGQTISTSRTARWSSQRYSMNEKKEIVCELIRADVPTANGNIYSKEALERAVEQFNQASKRDTCFVVKDNPSDGRMLLKDVVAKVHDTKLRDGRLVCQVEVLDTPAALEMNLKMLLEHGTITPVAYGSTKDGVVDENDLRVVGFSYVYNGPKK